MRVVVLVKQVPETDSVGVDPARGTLVREGVSSILNPFCEYALDQAVGLRSQGVEIVAVSMGPPQARAALLRCLELGVDRAILISDRALAGSDCWATSLVLAACLRRMVGGFDLVLAGRQAIDGDTAQIPAETAEMLGIPQITNCSGLSVRGEWVEAIREVEGGREVVRAKMPVLVSIGRGNNIRRFPTMAEYLAARGKELRVVGADDLGLDADRIGLFGSLTQVTRVFPPPVRGKGRVVDGSDPEVAAAALIKFLEGKGVIGGGERR